MKKIIIIGCGPSGITAGIYAKNKKNEVIILEKNNKSLKKLLITGNGKCNYFNEDFSIKHYYSSDIDKLSNIINEQNKKRVLEFISNIGIVPRIKNGYYYPLSNQAYSIHNALIKEAQIRGVRIINNANVLNIIKEKDKFIIKTTNEEYIADKVVIATGSKAYPKTGSDGAGYELAKNLNHRINKVYPGLAGLKSNDKFIKDLSGVRSEVAVALYSDKLIKEEKGEIQFNDNGISGICIYNLSNYVGKLIDNRKKVSVKVNFLNELNISNTKALIKLLDSTNNKIYKRTITELLEGFLNYKIVNVILKKCQIDNSLSWDNITYKQKETIADSLTNFIINITGIKEYDNAQICVGGIPLTDIDSKFESKHIPNLYFTGEVIDVAGDCGGYNLGFAFLSGMIVGDDIRND